MSNPFPSSSACRHPYSTIHVMGRKGGGEAVSKRRKRAGARAISIGNDVKTHTPYIGELPSRIGLGATVGFAHREYVNAHLPGGLTRREPPGRPCGRNPPYSSQKYIYSRSFFGGGKSWRESATIGGVPLCSQSTAAAFVRRVCVAALTNPLERLDLHKPKISQN